MSAKDKHIAWAKTVEVKVKNFAEKYSMVYCKNKRELSASFEIGCFHALLHYYQEMGYLVTPINLTKAGEFRYLTTPSGNPANFSYVTLSSNEGDYEIRQQVRIHSDIDKDIAFSPDITVLFKDSEIYSETDKDYAKGKRKFYTVASKDVVAAHECKSMVPFPELMVSFIGMFTTAHAWYRYKNWKKFWNNEGTHLAPTLFVGGCASGVHLKMIFAIQRAFPVNIVVGLHQGTWNLYSDSKKLNLLKIVKRKPKVMPLDDLEVEDLNQII
jgi:hypothetical protein